MDNATTMQTALANIRWTVGPVQVQANGERGFYVRQPAKADKRGNLVAAAEHQIRSFDARGTMTITRGAAAEAAAAQVVA